MKFFFISLFFIIGLNAEQYFYIPLSGEKVIQVLKADETSGALKLVQKVPTERLPGSAVVSPDKSFLYVASSEAKRKNPGLETYKILNDGKIKKVASAKTPYFLGFMALDNESNYLLASSYRDGNVSYCALENGIYKGKVAGENITEKSAHSVIFDHSNKFVYVPHTRPNSIYQFKFLNGKLKALEPYTAKGPDMTKNYHAPRHIVKHPAKNIFYTSNEAGGGISSWKMEANGQLKLWQTFSSLPDGADWRSMAADIKISADGRFAYVTNRYKGKETPLKDSIASFVIDSQSGKIIKRSGITPTMPVPSSISFGANDKYLYLLSSKSMVLTHYLVNQQDGTLKKIKDYKPGLTPTSIVSVIK